LFDEKAFDTPGTELRASKRLRSIVPANERLLTPDGYCGEAAVGKADF
jgi:hypothetical protein